MKPLKIFGIAVVVGLIVVLMMERAAREKLRVENESLSQQLAQLQTENENFSNQLAQAKSAPAFSDQKMSELMKLRGEVGVLRNQVGQLGKVADENQQLRSKNSAAQNQTGELTPDEQFHLQTWHTEDALKQISLAARIWAGDNNDQCPTNFDQLKSELAGVTNFPGNINIANFEFMNIGVANFSTPQLIMFRERIPRIDQNGSQYRVYGLADGSVQDIYSGKNENGKSFTEFEMEHSPPLSQ